MDNIASNNGFTLVELIAVLAILSVLMTITASFLEFSLKTYKNYNDQSQIQNDARRALQVITKDILSASSIKLESNANVNVGSYTITVIPPVLIIINQGKIIKYYKKNSSDNRLIRNINGTENYAIKNLKQFLFPDYKPPIPIPNNYYEDYSNKVLTLQIITQHDSINNFSITTKLYSRINN